MRQLSQQTVSLINSGQVITSVSSAVKELIENAVDAGSRSVEVRLDNHGLNKISVKDDGRGVKKDDMPLMPCKSYTSKINQFSDISTVSSYGFRGEALHALATVSDLSITSKTAEDLGATTINFDKKGQPKNASTVAATQGTLIVASNLFSNIPVRRSYAQKGGRPREELKKVENIVASFALICHHIRISLYHNNKQIFVKSKASTFDQSVAMTFGQSCLKSLHCLTEPEFSAYFPRKATSTQGDGVLGGSKADRKLFVFVNSRPVVDKKVEKLVRECVKENGLVIIALTLPTEELDVNLDPNKNSVFYAKQTQILDKLRESVNAYYSQVEETIEGSSPAGDAAAAADRVQPLEVSSTSTGVKTTHNPQDKFLDADILSIGYGTTSAETKTVNRSEKITENEFDVIFEKTLGEVNQENTAHPSEYSNKSFNDLKNYGSGQEIVMNGMGPRLTHHQVESRPRLIPDYQADEKERLAFQMSLEKENSSPRLASSPLDIRPSTSRNAIPSKEIERSWARGNMLKTSSNKIISPVEMLKQPPITSAFDISINTQDLLQTQEESVMPRKKRKSSEENAGNLSTVVGLRMAAMDRETTSPLSSTKRHRVDDLQPPENTRKISEVFKPVPHVKDRQKLRQGVGNATLEALAASECTPRLDQCHEERSGEVSGARNIQRRNVSRRCVNIDFDLKRLVTEAKGTPSSQASTQPVQQEGICVVGQLKPSGFWLTLGRGHLKVVNHHRAQELNIFQRLMESYGFPCQHTFKPPIDPSTHPRWTQDLNETLLSLVDTEDQRLSLNGFQLRRGIEQRHTVILEGAWSSKQALEDLIGLIEFIHQYREASIQDSRPPKFKAFLEGEAVRMQRQAPPSVSRQEIECLLRNIQDDTSCLHQKHILSATIHNFN